MLANRSASVLALRNHFGVKSLGVEVDTVLCLCRFNLS